MPALPVDLRRARGADTRAQILEAARDELAGVGYANTTTRSIAERAGVGLSLVHYHFGGKQQLLAAVLVSENERLLERQRALFDGPNSLADKWRAACAYLREDVRSGYVRILWELWAVGLSEPELAATWREAIAGWRALLTRVATEWSAGLALPLSVSPQVLVTLVANAFQGAEAEILAGVIENEAPHLEALESVAELIDGRRRERDEGPGRPGPSRSAVEARVGWRCVAGVGDAVRPDELDAAGRTVRACGLGEDGHACPVEAVLAGTSRDARVPRQPGSACLAPGDGDLGRPARVGSGIDDAELALVLLVATVDLVLGGRDGRPGDPTCQGGGDQCTGYRAE